MRGLYCGSNLLAKRGRRHHLIGQHTTERLTCCDYNGRLTRCTQDWRYSQQIPTFSDEPWRYIAILSLHGA